MTKSQDFTSNKYFHSIDDVGAAVEKHGSYSDVYVGLATSTSESGQEGSIYRRQTIMVDFDKKDYPALSDCSDFINLFKQNAKMVFYHAITDTGGGYHFYVSIEPTDDCKRVAALNRALADLVGADLKAASVTQMDRLPTGLNHKYNPCIPVRVVANTFGTPNHKPYPLGVLEKMVAKAQQRKEAELEIAQQPPKKCEGVKAFRCVEAMIAQGAEQGERNFCLGRICCYLRDIRGYTATIAYETVKQFNTRCSPPKKESELKSQFDRYWNNADYHLLGCSISDTAKAKTLLKYCDKTLCNNSTVTIFDVEEAPPVLIGNNMLRREDFKRLRGNHFLILTVLHYKSEGLTRRELTFELTPRKGKCAICRSTLSGIIQDLLRLKYIKYDGNKKLFSVRTTAEFGLGHTRLYYSAAIARINNIISAQEYLVYVGLVKLLDADKHASFEELSVLTGIDKSGISRHISALEYAHMIHIGQVQMGNGRLCNSYLIRA